MWHGRRYAFRACWHRRRSFLLGSTANTTLSACVTRVQSNDITARAYPPQPHLSRPIVPPRRAVRDERAGGGYWLAFSNGGVYSFGNASFHGSLAVKHLGSSGKTMAATPDGEGYWLATAGGRVYSFGDARSEPLDGGIPLRGRVAAMARTPDGRGYWLATSTGGVYVFGGATSHGSLATKHVLSPVVSLAATADGPGYWLATSNGAVDAFGNAKFEGSWTGLPLTRHVAAMRAQR